MLSYRYTIQLVKTGNPVNSYLTYTVDKTHHGSAMLLFLRFFNSAGGALVTNLCYCY